MKNLLLSFDVEEFNFPVECGIPFSEEEQYDLSYKGLIKILNLLDKLNIKATFFVTYNFAKRYEDLIKKMSLNHEIASHGYSHSDNYKKMDESVIYERLKEAKEKTEKIINKKMKGFRAPKLYKPSYKLLSRLGFEYDGSVNPTFIPGHYNDFFTKRKIFLKEGIKVIPASVIPIIRFPLFWLTFHNLNLGLYRLLSKLCFIGTGFFNLYMHPWEFMNLKNMKLPFFIKNNTGDKLIKKLEDFITKENFKVYRYDEFLAKSL